MKIAIITDQHLDGRKGSLAFWNYWQKFYDNIFFPTLEKENIDTVIDLGDTFDNRKSMDYNAFARAKQHYFDKLKLKKINLHMLVGNHCTYYKNTNKINSPKLLLQQYNNIKVYDKPTAVNFDGMPFLMLPWITSDNQEETFKLLKDSVATVVCGHLELSGFEIVPGMKMEHGMDPKPFSNFHRVWSGHYHHKSKKGNIQYLGNPYEMFWNDCDDTRGFHIYDTDKDRLRFVANPYKIFKKIYYNDNFSDPLSTKPFATTGYGSLPWDEYQNTFVKIIVEGKTNQSTFDKLIDSLYAVGVHDIKVVETLVSEDSNIVSDDLEIKDTMSLLRDYVDEVETSVDKDNLKQLLQTLYIESLEVV